ncbi:MAG: large conductance mechanosensitive channel protein MscL [Anaerolineae bacterium CFX3]|nr:large conductance mechanosensitive channel protein MscL [Anaerolineae bacterium]MCE7906542.1 large conductance mechanosensitive channel protein MscL [Anaerolineae bacterium CFX3]MCQ3947400.1 large conductance mechanosensitive channel protein MscL [Anaerolineae bacterium]RIK24710.1 MAG: large conductance mechanosensitive channel protein MscL [Anaerolineae bacterium]
MLKEFKDFVMRGNVLDLAVAVIIGGAFGKIVASLVNDVIMPFIGILMGGISFTSLEAKVGTAVIQYGVFIQSIVDFLLVAFVVFLIVKAANSLRKPAPAAEPTTRECPRCFSTIHLKATRCPNCTSEL